MGINNIGSFLHKNTWFYPYKRVEVYEYNYGYKLNARDRKAVSSDSKYAWRKEYERATDEKTRDAIH